MKLKQMCLVLVAALILSLAVCAAVFAETSGDFEYQINPDGATAAITRCTSRDEALVIPPEIDGYKVTDLKISNGNANITSISIPDSVTNITRGSITGLTNLTEVTVSNGNETYSSADGILFDKEKTRLIVCPRKKSADTYAVPSSVKTIGVQAFANTSEIKAITLPEGLQAIEDTAFANCAAVVNIPPGVTEIGTGAFGRKKLREIVLSDDNKDFVISDDVLYSADMTRLLVYSDEKTDAELKLPETVASIDNYAFYNNKNLITAIVPDSVTNIGNYAFLQCYNLTSAKLPDALTVIPTGIYQSCRNLKRFEVGGNVKEIGNFAFSGCDNLAISIPESVTEIGINVVTKTLNGTTTIYGAAGSYAETYANQNNIPFADISTMPTSEPMPTDVPKPTSSPGDTGIYENWTYVVNDDNTVSLTAYISTSNAPTILEVPAEIGGMTVTRIDGRLFNSVARVQNLTEVVLPDTITYIGNGAFRSCPYLSKINFPEGLTEIGAATFAGCSALTSAAFPDSLITIGANAFNATGLSSVLIPENVASISANAFSGCADLTEIEVAPENTIYGSKDGVLYDAGITELIYYPSAKTESEYVVPITLEKINDGALVDCSNLTTIDVSAGNTVFASVDGVLYSIDKSVLIRFPSGKNVSEFQIPDSVTEIGSYAFYNNININAVTGTPNVKTVSSRAFYQCSALKGVSGFENVTDVGAYAFYLSSLEELNTFVNLVNIGDRAFSSCEYLSDISALTKVENIGAYAFYGCNLTSVKGLSNLKTIGNFAFYGNRSLVDFEFSDGLISIGENAFLNCYALKEVEIPDSVTDIKTGAFRFCDSLESIKIGSGVTSIPEECFFNSKVTFLVIPESVKNIKLNAFAQCRKLTEVYYLGSETEWADIVIESGNDILLRAKINYEASPDVTSPPVTPTPGPNATPTPISTPTPTAKPTQAPPTAPPRATRPPATAEPTDTMPWKINSFYGNSISISVGDSAEEGTPFTVIAAKYKDDVLIDVSVEDLTTKCPAGMSFYADLSSVPSVTGEGEYIKIMLWDSTDGCRPLALPYTTTPLLTAFPGAEGGGKYSTGGRGRGGAEVYHVTNLNDSGPGSFRDAVSEPGRIIVFDVGGTINLEKSIRYIGGVTILGQTAPGDGITITGANLELDGGNIIRYLRIRPTFKNKIEADGLGGYGDTRTMIDHCSVSYSIDECISFYEYTDFTLQNCISSESLKNGGHSKGAHGYGGIWGGTNASFHHNLLASHDSRNPRLAAGRLEGDIDYDMSEQVTLTDLRNNIIYNWGGNSAYGGQGAMAANIINSYYKPGPSTTSHRSRIFQTTSTGNGITSKWATDLYVDGNYMDGNQSVTADNSKGVDHDSTVAQYYVWTKDNITDEAKAVHFKYEDDYPVTTQTAEETYNTLLDHIGASLPRRDETDARIISEVRNGQGRIIDNEAEVGGVMQYPTVYRWFEIPQEWKDANGMGGAYEGDIVPNGKWKGYTWIEAYVNEWTEQQENPTNPDVTANASASGNNIAVLAEASSIGDSPITKIVIYDGDKIISEHETDKVNVNIVNAEAGKHYISALAYNQKGESTRSTIAVVEVK